MAKITLAYPATWLTVSLILTNTTTEVVDFSWVANEIWSTGVYEYIFTEAVSTDYTYVATVPGYNTMSWIIYQDSTSWWWASAADIWWYTSKPLIVNMGDISKIL